MVSQELRQLGEPISDRRLRNLYAKAIPQKYQHVVTAADMDGTIGDVKGYVFYINKAINRTLTRAMERDQITDHGMMNTLATLNQGRSPGRRRPSDQQNRADHERVDRATKYGEATITRATTDILNEYGCLATRELVDKVGKMIGDYLQFEHDEGNTEMHLADTRYKGRPPPLAREVQKQRGEPRAREGKGVGRQALCFNCGEMGCRAKICPKPKAQCTHPVCRKRGIHNHCDKVCFFYHRELCPPYLLDKRDKLMQEWEQEKQHHDADYVDEDTDGEDYMQMGDTPNYYFYSTEEDVPRMKNTADLDDNTSHQNHEVKEDVHCLEYLVDKDPKEFYDHLMFMAYKIYKRKLIPMHAILEVTLSTIFDFVKHCNPRQPHLREAMDHIGCMGAGLLELLKGAHLSAILEAVLHSDRTHSVAELLVNCLQSLSADDTEDKGGEEMRDPPTDGRATKGCTSNNPAGGRWYEDPGELARILGLLGHPTTDGTARLYGEASSQPALGGPDDDTPEAVPTNMGGRGMTRPESDKAGGKKRSFLTCHRKCRQHRDRRARSGARVRQRGEGSADEAMLGEFRDEDRTCGPALETSGPDDSEYSKPTRRGHEVQGTGSLLQGPFGKRARLGTSILGPAGHL